MAEKHTLAKGIWQLISVNGDIAKLIITSHVCCCVLKLLLLFFLKNQSTAEFKSDSITLIVALDSLGKAKGVLYADAGDGSGYKKGEYCITQFNALRRETNLFK